MVGTKGLYRSNENEYAETSGTMRMRVNAFPSVQFMGKPYV
jgi:hypothetical protein